jgi:hypothetical protein
MDHLQALAKDERAPEAVRAAARQLVEAPLATNVIPLGRGDTRHVDAARVIVDEARRRVGAS